MRTETAVTINEKTSPRVLTAAVATAVSMLLCTGFTMMMSTSLGLGLSVKRLLFAAFITSLVFASVFLINRKWLSFAALISAPALFALSLVFDWFNVKTGLFALLHFIKLYVFLWLPGDYPEDPDGAKTILAFVVMYNLIALSVTCFVLMKRKFIPAVLLFYLPMFIFSVSNTDISPKSTYCLVAGAGLVMLLLCNAFRKKKQSTYERVLIVLMLPVLLFMFLIGGIFPQAKYNKDKLATNILLELRYRAEKLAGSDSVLSEIINRALNGFENMDFDDTFDTVSPLYSTPTNLSRVGPFNPSEDEVLKVTRKTNPAYAGAAPLYGGNVLYLKIESSDKYANNMLSSTKIKGRIYESVNDLPSETAQYSLTISPLKSATVDVVPYYSDHYYMDGVQQTKLNPYNTTREYIKTFASANIPVKTGNVYTQNYLNNYVYKTCLEVPYRTQSVLITSGKLPEWYLDVYYGRVEMSDAEKVERVTEYVRGLHPYDSNTKYPPAGEDFVTWFILKGETGICIHYAVSSMVLLRMIGIPARYVRGYVDTDSGLDKESVVRASQAHAWFEVFVPEYGWVLGDATPGYRNEQEYFNLDAIARTHPEVKSAQLTKGDGVNEADPGKETETVTETTEETTAEETTTKESETAGPDETAASGNESWKVTVETKANGDVDSEKEESEWKGYVLRAFKLFLTIFITAAAVFIIVLTGRAVFVIYWLRRFRAEKINDRAVAYYHYFSLMARVFRFVFPDTVRGTAEKATFSGRDITAKELSAMISTCRKIMKDTSADLSGYRKPLYRLMVIPNFGKKKASS